MPGRCLNRADSGAPATLGGKENGSYPIMGNQMEKKMENEMETGIIKKMELGLYRGHLCSISYNLNQLKFDRVLYWVYIGVILGLIGLMEKKMEATT